jgi:hypothetical protein
MEAGSPIRVALTLEGITGERPNQVRQQLNTKFTQSVMQDIIQDVVRPNMPNVRIEQVTANAIGREGVTVADIDGYIATCQACLTDLQAKKAELEA